MDGRECDSKAICDVAYLLNHPDGARPKHFSGGVYGTDAAATYLAVELGHRTSYELGKWALNGQAP